MHRVRSHSLAAIDWRVARCTVQKETKAAMSDVDQIQEACEAVISFFQSNQAPEQAVAQLQGLELPDNADALLSRSEELGLCLAYIDHQQLAKLLARAWDVLCHYLENMRKKSWRKFTALEETGKAEPEVLEEAQKARDEMDAKCKTVAIQFYKFRALMDLPEEKFEHPVM